MSLLPYAPDQTVLFFFAEGIFYNVDFRYNRGNSFSFSEVSFHYPDDRSDRAAIIDIRHQAIKSLYPSGVDLAGYLHIDDALQDRTFDFEYFAYVPRTQGFVRVEHPPNSGKYPFNCPQVSKYSQVKLLDLLILFLSVDCQKKRKDGHRVGS